MERASQTDWHRADIMAALRKEGWTLRALSHAHHLHGSTCERALRRPYPRAERIIADALQLEPWQLWPSRYTDDHTPRRRRRTVPLVPQSTARGTLCNGDRTAKICPTDDRAIAPTTTTAAMSGSREEAAA